MTKGEYKENTHIIFSDTVAAYLILQGCRLCSCKKDLKKPWKRLFFFESSSLLDKSLLFYDEYKKDIHKLYRAIKVED